jgi:hypothetical protein
MADGSGLRQRGGGGGGGGGRAALGTGVLPHLFGVMGRQVNGRSSEIKMLIHTRARPHSPVVAHSSHTRARDPISRSPAAVLGSYLPSVSVLLGGHHPKGEDAQTAHEGHA